MELLESQPGCYSGLGLMLDTPLLHIRIRKAADEPTRGIEPTQGIGTDRESCSSVTRAFEVGQVSESMFQQYQQRIQTWIDSHWATFPDLDSLKVDVVQAYPLHCGLGSGTQLASLLSMAAELIQATQPMPNQWQELRQLAPNLNAPLLAQKSGRGRRSFIGLQGFLYGNLILDSGLSNWQRQLKTATTDTPAEQTSTDRTRSFYIPKAWKIVLIRPAESSHITGQQEQSLMDRLNGQPNPFREVMWRCAMDCCLAAQLGDFERFAESLELYLDYAARLFSSTQGGRFNGPDCQAAVLAARKAGLRAVGQSSWGPTIFGSAGDGDTAAWAARQIRGYYPNWAVCVASAASQGAQIRSSFQS